MNPVQGTEILFFENGKWWNKNSNGIVVATNTDSYYKRYKLKDSLVVIKGDDDEFISNLNPGYITVVVDKNLIGRPNLLSMPQTKEWMSLAHFLKLRKETAYFCIMAKNFYIPNKD